MDDKRGKSGPPSEKEVLHFDDARVNSADGSARDRYQIQEDSEDNYSDEQNEGQMETPQM